MNENRYETLTDHEIIECAENNELIIEDFNRENVKQACYELRVGNYYYDLDDDDKKYEIGDGVFVLLKPSKGTFVPIKMLAYCGERFYSPAKSAGFGRILGPICRSTRSSSQSEIPPKIPAD